MEAELEAEVVCSASVKDLRLQARPGSLARALHAVEAPGAVRQADGD